MIDTIKLALRSWEAGGIDFIEKVLPGLSLKNPQPLRGDGISGNLGNMLLYIWPQKICVSGSLNKWYLEENYTTMQPEQIPLAIEKLQDVLCLPMEKAKLCRVDVGVTLPVNEPVANYINHLGTRSTGERLPYMMDGQTTGVKYRCKTEELLFYDKHKESKIHKALIPEDWALHNALRVELQTKTSKLMLGQLSTPTITNAYLDKLAVEYKQIPKIHDVMINLTNLNWRAAADLTFIERLGGQEAALQDVKERQRKGEFTSTQACRMRKRIKELCELGRPGIIQSPAVVELDNVISKTIATLKR